jgi:hypothetical protein
VEGEAATEVRWSCFLLKDDGWVLLASPWLLEVGGSHCSRKGCRAVHVPHFATLFTKKGLFDPHIRLLRLASEQRFFDQ